LNAPCPRCASPKPDDCKDPWCPLKVRVPLIELPEKVSAAQALPPAARVARYNIGAGE